jgi:hypothetical protein
MREQCALEGLSTERRWNSERMRLGLKFAIS